MTGLSATLNSVRTLTMSSMVKVVNWMFVNSSKNSSADVGNETPPKSVRWVQLQCKKPSGRPDGGGEATHPSVLQAPRGLSQYWHCTPVSQERPVKPVLQTQSPCVHMPLLLQKLYSLQSPRPQSSSQKTGGAAGGGAAGGGLGGGGEGGGGENGGMPGGE